MTADRLTQIILGAAPLQGLCASQRQAAFDALPEADRLCIIRSAGQVPEACGPELPASPARGPLRVFDILTSVEDSNGNTVLHPAGFLGRKTAQRLDAFGVMAAQAARKGGLGLNASQIGMGRIYAALVQDHESVPVRGISVEAMCGGGRGTAEGFTDHRLDQARRIERLRQRIGAGCAMAVRRVRPSARGDGAAPRRNIADRVLVDQVCLQDMTISDVLRQHGWSVKGDTVRAATQALAAALDRMIGPVRRDIRVVHYGERAVWQHGQDGD